MVKIISICGKKNKKLAKKKLIVAKISNNNGTLSIFYGNSKYVSKKNFPRIFGIVGIIAILGILGILGIVGLLNFIN